MFWPPINGPQARLVMYWTNLPRWVNFYRTYFGQPTSSVQRRQSLIISISRGNAGLVNGWRCRRKGEWFGDRQPRRMPCHFQQPHFGSTIRIPRAAEDPTHQIPAPECDGSNPKEISHSRVSLLVNAHTMHGLGEDAAPPRAKRQRCAAACETCKRRKERCDGREPCRRCLERAVSNQCYFIELPTRRRRTSDRAVRKGRHSVVSSTPIVPESVQEAQPVEEATSTLQPSDSGLDTRLLLDPRGRYMFIGDSANLSFLQVLRRVVGECIGSCSFVDDPLRSLMVEMSPEGQPSWMEASSQSESRRYQVNAVPALLSSLHA